jgi:hypothetical protein
VVVIDERRRCWVIQGKRQGPPGRVCAFTVTIVGVVGIVIAVLGHPVPSVAAAVITTALSRLLLGLPPSADLPFELVSRAFGSRSGLTKSRHPTDDTNLGLDDLPPVISSGQSSLPKGGNPSDQDQ